MYAGKPAGNRTASVAGRQPRLPTQAGVEGEARTDLPIILEPEVVPHLHDVLGSGSELRELVRQPEQEVGKRVAGARNGRGTCALPVERPITGSGGYVQRVLMVPLNASAELKQVTAAGVAHLHVAFVSFGVQFQRSAAE